MEVQPRDFYPDKISIICASTVSLETGIVGEKRKKKLRYWEDRT